MLASPLRIKKTEEFSAVYDKKCSKANAYLVIYQKENGLGHPRFGFSISKKVGKAHDRNLVRRRLSEIIRLHLSGFRATDIVMVARKPIVELDYKTLEKEFLKLSERSGIYETKPTQEDDTLADSLLS